MSQHDEKRQPIIITEGKEENATPRTTKARGLLYDLIVRFRKDAREADSSATRAIFEFAAETLSGIVRAFKEHERSKQKAEHNSH
jgi:hypothetical protein